MHIHVSLLPWTPFPSRLLPIVRFLNILCARIPCRPCHMSLRGCNHLGNLQGPQAAQRTGPAHVNPLWLSCEAFLNFSSVAQSCLTLWPHGLQYSRLPYPSPASRAYSISCPSSQWCHPTISSSAVPFSSCFQSFPASGSFPRNQFFTSGGQTIGVSTSASVLPMNIQDWFPLRLTCWISLQSKGLSRVFSNTTVQKHQFFGTQLSL